MMAHPVFALFSAAVVSGVLALAEDRTPRERWAAAARTFSWCAAAIVGGSWLMRLIHG